MNDILNPYVSFINVLIYSNNIDQHFKHFAQFHKIAKQNGIVLFKRKMVLVQLKIRYSGHEIQKGYIKPIQRVIEFSSKFHDELSDKT